MTEKKGTEEAGEELLSREQQRRTQKRMRLFIKKQKHETSGSISY